MTQLCAGCGHPALAHGDRAVAACDGNYNDPHRVNRLHGPWSKPGPVCACTGWRRFIE